MLTPDQVHEILGLLDRQMTFFAGSTMGEYVLTDQDKINLARYGVDYRSIYDPKKDIATLNFHLGMLSDILGSNVQDISFPDLVKYISGGEHIPLNEKEKAVVQSIKMQSLADIKASSGKIFQDINNVVTKSLSTNRADQEEFIREQIRSGIASRRNRRDIAREIAKLTGDWSRNFEKSVSYISHTALNEGRAAMVERRYGKDSKVYFQVQPKACDHCVKAYLTDGAGSEPKLFSIGDLQRNGNNIGRKVAEWLPSIHSLHPHCRCLLTEYIPGTFWNGVKFAFPKGEYQSQVKRPKIRVVFNGKEHFV